MEEHISKCTKTFLLYGPHIRNLLICIVLILAMFMNLLFPTNDTISNDDIKYLQRKYPGQENDTWLAFERGLKDVREFNRPVVFILLHTKNEASVTSNLLKDAAKYFTLNLQDNETEPIVLTPDILNSPKFLRDHGEVIESYVGLLRERSVMIVENLENVASEPARAFHSFCDEYSPIVEKSVIVFTVEVAEIPENVDNYLQNFLQERWSTISEDIFMALYTRISNMILKINPESTVMVDNSIKSSFDIYWGSINLIPILLIVFIIECNLRRFNSEFRELLQKYPSFSNSICDLLLNVRPFHHYFVMCDVQEFYDDLTKYIKNRSEIENNFKVIDNTTVDEFCRNIQDGTLLVENYHSYILVIIYDIETFQDELLKIFKSNERVREVLKNYKINIYFVYQVLSMENCTTLKELQKILNNDFYELLQEERIKIISQNC